MKLRGVTGGECGNAVYSNSDIVLSDAVLNKAFIDGESGGGVFSASGSISLYRNGGSTIYTKYPTPDGLNLKGTALNFASTAYIKLVDNFSLGFEVITAIYSGDAAGSVNYPAVQFTCDGNTYVIKHTTSNGWYVNGGSASLIGGTNTHNKAANSYEVLYMRAFHDGTDLHIQLVNSSLLTNLIHFKDTGVTGTISDVRIAANKNTGYADDITVYESEAADITAYSKSSWTTFDFQNHLREIVAVCKTTATYTANQQSYADNDPTDWETNAGLSTEAAVYATLTDGSDLTYSTGGTDKVGIETTATVQQILTDSGLLGSALEAIVPKSWRVADDDGQNIDLSTDVGAGFVTKGKTGAVGQDGMITALFDRTGLTGSDGSPIALSTNGIKGTFSI